ncbi:MAG: protein translocase SEC61 complex subunit gamma [Candidatus Thermoplasmatota archaeon]
MDIVESSWKIQRWIENKAKGMGKGRYGRVLKMARKPTSDEYVKVLQITSIGLILIGFLGFVVYYIFLQAPGLLRGISG